MENDSALEDTIVATNNKKRKPQDPLFSPKPQKQKSVGELCCSICSKLFSRKDNLKRHISRTWGHQLVHYIDLNNYYDFESEDFLCYNLYCVNSSHLNSFTAD